MTEDKYCERCGKYIGNIETYPKGYYSFIRVKYCDDCRNAMETMDSRQRMKQYRKRKKEEQEELLKQNELLKRENETLRNQIIKLREVIKNEKSNSNIDSSNDNGKHGKRIFIRKKHKR